MKYSYREKKNILTNSDVRIKKCRVSLALGTKLRVTLTNEFLSREFNFLSDALSQFLLHEYFKQLNIVKTFAISFSNIDSRISVILWW